MVKKMSENDKKQMKMIKNDENRRKIGKKKKVRTVSKTRVDG